MRAMPVNKKILPRAEYINFAQTAIDYLKHDQRTIIISPSPYKNGFTFKFAFKTKGELVDVDILKPGDKDLPDVLPDALAKRLNERDIKRIILSSGVKEQDLLDLIDSIRVVLPDSLMGFDRPNIEIEYAEKGEKEKVHSFPMISPPPQVETKVFKRKKFPSELKPWGAPTPRPTKELDKMTPEELLKAGKELNKLIFVKESVEESREEIKEWISLVEIAIERYIRDIKRNPELLAKRYIYLDLEKRRRQFARHPRIRMNLKEFEIPSRQISMERRPQKRETKSYSDPFLEWLKEQPFYSLTFEPGLALIYRRFQMRVLHGECQQIISTWERHGRSMLDEKELNELILWLRYLLEGDNLERKYHKENERTLKRFRTDFQKFHAEFVRIWHKIAFDE